MAKVRKERSEKLKKVDEAVEICTSLGGIFGKFGGFVEKLGELAEKGEELSQTGELKGVDPEGKLRGVYGVSFKTCLGPEGEQELKVEPFGNVREEPSGETVVDDVREPLVDVHQEEDHVLVIGELPGVSKQDIALELSEDRLTLRGRRGDTKYRKEVVLPQSFSEDQMTWTCKNGILKVRLERS
ncbi:MAG: Hsp20/alpha crystallin family protein [Planctomycetia bacterium]|nr:Hsp20/alpha crystallin family protein [Planctomycetia bacterium]